MSKIVGHSKVKRRRRRLVIDYLDTNSKSDGGLEMTEAQRMTISKIINAVISILTVLATKIFC